ncbi:Iron-sulfur cluster assembly protein 1 [Dendrobium catenatum]|uniref:Iron-sulfur cluster assembly protein n=2 Tax=Dendrobium catenatum TaxID=906689 RepID=A0A2I0XGB8_9ASPA|nr:Iron-sulfur cluster assembly protein 1 [Dendrobium catenatum]
MLRAGGKRLLGIGFVRQVAASPAAAATATATAARSYHERVVDHYNNPRNVGAFDKKDPTVGTGLVGAPACGDVMKLQIKVDENTGKIVDACFKTFGCGSAIASSSVATEWVKGKKIEEVLSIKNTAIANHLSLPPVKLHCSMLAEDAIKAAVKDYEKKRDKLGQNKEPALDTAEKAANA